MNPPETSAHDARPVTANGILDLGADRTRRICWNCILAFIAIGAVGRIKQYVSRPSYWNDEAAVVANVIHRDARHLLDRLDFAQAAPPLFLWIERGAYLAFGGNEFSLRLVPFLLGLFALPLYARLAWRTLPVTSAVWAVGWFALFQRILHGAHYVKQYSGDVFVAIALMSIVFGRADPVTPARRMGQLSLAAALLLWFSFPVVFLYAAISIALFPACASAGKRGLMVWSVGGACVLGSFLCLHHVALSHGGDPTLVEFWHDSFPDWHHPLTIPPWLAREIHGLFAYPFDSLGLLTTLLAVFGCIALWKRRQFQLLAVLPLRAGHRVGRGVDAEISVSRSASPWPLFGPIDALDRSRRRGGAKPGVEGQMVPLVVLVATTAPRAGSGAGREGFGDARAGLDHPASGRIRACSSPWG